MYTLVNSKASNSLSCSSPCNRTRHLSLLSHKRSLLLHVPLHIIYQLTKAHGKITVGGTASTVVPSGGYVHGGGHSALSPTFGLLADNSSEKRSFTYLPSSPEFKIYVQKCVYRPEFHVKVPIILAC